MAPQTPQQVENGTESSRMTGASSITPPTGTKLQWRHHFAHCDTANAANANMTLDSQLKIGCKSVRSKYKNQHVITCEYSRIKVDDRQLTIYHAAGVRRELRDQVLAAYRWKPPCLTKAFIRKVREIEHHDVVSSGIFA